MKLPIELWMGLSLLAILLLMAFLLFLGWKRQSQRRASPSPYASEVLLRPASQIGYEARYRVVRFLIEKESWENPLFNLKWASYCRETGRLFFDSVDWLGRIEVKWDFLIKRYPGSFVSWGSLNREQQEAVRACHKSLEGFQTERSSSQSAPRQIEPEYARAKPGPLYVDPESKVLLGWKLVPETSLEVLVVQKPYKKT